MKTIALLLVLCGTLAAQVAEQANRDYQTEQGRQRMLGTLGAADRSQRIGAERIIASIDLRPGMTVADIGTGAGVMLPYFSKAVGPKGTVVAQDIFPDFLDNAKKTAREAGLTNVAFELGTDKDPGLPLACCDVAVTIDAYHHFDYPAQTLAGIAKGLKPGGRLVIVEYYKRENAMGPGRRAIDHIRLDMDDAIKEVEGNGFKLVSKKDHVPGSQWLGIFEKK